jgi:hypothetical protein
MNTCSKSTGRRRADARASHQRDATLELAVESIFAIGVAGVRSRRRRGLKRRWVSDSRSAITASVNTTMRPTRSECEQEREQVVLLVAAQVSLEHKVEKLDSILQRQ